MHTHARSDTDKHRMLGGEVCKGSRRVQLCPLTCLVRTEQFALVKQMTSFLVSSALRANTCSVLFATINFPQSKVAINKFSIIYNASRGQKRQVGL